MKIQVYDPPMCCSTGVCGPAVNPELVRFSADLDWLKGQGVDVERFNLSQQPASFVENPVVKEALAKDSGCLPLTLADGAVVCTARYPSREMLAGYAQVGARPTVVTDAVRELVAIGAAIACNCEPCFKHHYNEARKLGLSKGDIRVAVDVAQAVKEAPSRSILELADKYLREAPAKATACCCGPADSGACAPDAKPGGGSCC